MHFHQLFPGRGEPLPLSLSSSVIGIDLETNAVMGIHPGIFGIVVAVSVYIVGDDESCINPIGVVVPGKPDAEVEVGRIVGGGVPEVFEVQQRHARFADLIPFVYQPIVQVDLLQHLIRQLVEGVQPGSAVRFCHDRHGHDDQDFVHRSFPDSPFSVG